MSSSGDEYGLSEEEGDFFRDEDEDVDIDEEDDSDEMDDEDDEEMEYGSDSEDEAVRVFEAELDALEAIGWGFDGATMLK